MEIIYPLTHKLEATQPIMDDISEFVRWLEREKNIEIPNIDDLLYEFFDIDKNELEQERKKMLRKLAELASGG